MMPTGRFFLSVDVEDYFHVEAFSDRIRRDQWDSFPSRVAGNTRRVLELLARYNQRATFFVLGWVAERHPEIVREIYAAGHEIACHSHWHRLVYRLSPPEFRADTRRAKSRLEDLIGAPVLGYRAPSYSVTRQSLWALEVLVEEGLRYDSSIYPIVHDISGLPSYPRTPHRHTCGDGRSLIEFPGATFSVLGINWPFGGGGYLRLLPYAYTRWGLQQLAHQPHPYLSLYFHPWELDPEQPRMAGRLRSRLRHYTGLKDMQAKIERMLARYRFGRYGDGLAEFEEKAKLAMVATAVSSDAGRLGVSTHRNHPK